MARRKPVPYRSLTLWLIAASFVLALILILAALFGGRPV